MQGMKVERKPYLLASNTFGDAPARVIYCSTAPGRLQAGPADAVDAMMRPSLPRLACAASPRWRSPPRRRALRLRPRVLGLCEAPARLRPRRRASTTPRSRSIAPRSTRLMAAFAEPTAGQERALDAGPAAGVLDQRLQPVHASRDRRSLSDPLGAVHTAAAQQHPADRRRLDDADLARGRPHGDARRHRAPHPAAGVQGAARPLRRSTARRSAARRWRLSRTARATLDAQLDAAARRYLASEQACRSRAARWASRGFWNGMARTSWRVRAGRGRQPRIASNARFARVVVSGSDRPRPRPIWHGSRRPGSSSSTTTGR